MAEERMVYPPLKWDNAMMRVIAQTLGDCAKASPWKIMAASIEPTHFHALLTDSPVDIERSVKWIAQEMTKAVHRQTTHAGPVFCKGRWLQFIYDQSHWDNIIGYIDAHNARHGLPARPVDFEGSADRG
jgi:REP element-mobilizing transposase RayT